jgi:hypothetical protein
LEAKLEKLKEKEAAGGPGGPNAGMPGPNKPRTPGPKPRRPTDRKIKKDEL